MMAINLIAGVHYILKQSARRIDGFFVQDCLVLDYMNRDKQLHTYIYTYIQIYVSPKS